MKVTYRYAITLENVNYEDIHQPERVAIGKAIFFSLKYNATTGSTAGGLGKEFIDGIDVDGYYTVSQYVDLASVELKGESSGRLRCGSLKRRGRIKPLFRLFPFSENLSAFFSRLTKPSVRRRTTSHAYLEFSANIVTAERYIDQWDQTKVRLTERLKENIDNGYFQSVLQHPDGYVSHLHDGIIANTYSADQVRKLSTLATDSATITDSSSSLIELGMEVYSIEGNMPTGQPTSTPSTSVPTNYKFKVFNEGLDTKSTATPSTYPMSAIAILYTSGFLLFFVAEYKVSRSLKAAFDSNEKKTANKASKVAPAPQNDEVEVLHKNPEDSNVKRTLPPSMPSIQEGVDEDRDRGPVHVEVKAEKEESPPVGRFRASWPRCNHISTRGVSRPRNSRRCGSVL